jgi:hypothetical protein
VILTTWDPNRLVPYHGAQLERLRPHPCLTDPHLDPLDAFPPIPVFEIPADLEYAPGRLIRELGDYVLYNGHHRRMAAILAGIDAVRIAVLQTDADLTQLESHELLEIPSPAIADHQRRIYANAAKWAVAALEDQRELLASTNPNRAMGRQGIVETGALGLISTRVSQFSYFDQILGNPNWRGRRILDFGGNQAGFLVGAAEHVDHESYWCLDIVRAALAEGHAKFPRAHFVHYDRYHSEYNPSGVPDLPVPDLGLEFDYILAFSVFTHIDQKELIQHVARLRRMLAPSGTLAFTFTDPSYDTGLSIFPTGRYMNKLLTALACKYPGLDIEDTLERASRAKWSILIDDRLWIEPGDELCQQARRGKALESYCAYYSVDYMATLFPEGEIVPPVGEEWQHCCIIRNG